MNDNGQGARARGAIGSEIRRANCGEVAQDPAFTEQRWTQDQHTIWIYIALAIGHVPPVALARPHFARCPSLAASVSRIPKLLSGWTTERGQVKPQVRGLMLNTSPRRRTRSNPARSS